MVPEVPSCICQAQQEVGYTICVGISYTFDVDLVMEIDTSLSVVLSKRQKDSRLHMPVILYEKSVSSGMAHFHNNLYGHHATTYMQPLFI